MSSTCLSEQDDLDAINVLYPVCNDAQRVPRCIKDPQYLGLGNNASFASAEVFFKGKASIALSTPLNDLCPSRSAHERLCAPSPGGGARARHSDQQVLQDATGGLQPL